MASKKTNAMRFLDRNKLSYNDRTFPVDPEHLDALSVAQTLGLDPNQVFKTLVLQGSDNKYYVAVLPAPESLDFKKLAEFIGVKNVQMFSKKDLKALTGYVHGGCSPFAMKKTFKTFLHESAMDFSVIYVSAGELGHQLEISPRYIVDLLDAKVLDLIQ